jgi:hypothetical protein
LYDSVWIRNEASLKNITKRLSAKNYFKELRSKCTKYVTKQSEEEIP